MNIIFHNILESDCQTFALKCATGDLCHAFRHKNVKSKEIQRTRILDARIHLQPGEIQGQSELTKPADMKKAKELFIQFNQ